MYQSCDWSNFYFLPHANITTHKICLPSEQINYDVPWKTRASWWNIAITNRVFLCLTSATWWETLCLRLHQTIQRCEFFPEEFSEHSSLYYHRTVQGCGSSPELPSGSSDLWSPSTQPMLFNTIQCFFLNKFLMKFSVDGLGEDRFWF